jgi:hypothetical protein
VDATATTINPTHARGATEQPAFNPALRQRTRRAARTKRARGDATHHASARRMASRIVSQSDRACAAGEVLRDAAPAPRSQACATSGIHRELEDAGSECHSIANRHEETTDAVLDRLIRADGGGRHDRPPDRHRLERRLRHRLALRALHHDVHGREQLGDVVALPEERDGATQLGNGCGFRHHRRVAAPARDEEPRPRQLRANEPDRGE